MKRILVCEDEDAIREFVVINLNRSGYETVDVSNGEDAIATYDAEDGNFDLAILDIMLPGIDGFEVCRQLRQRSETMGIIMLTAKAQEMDKVRGLMTGADDYVTKPFSPSELTARVDAIFRRVSNVANVPLSKDEIVSGIFTLNVKSRSFKKGDEYIDLTQVEFQIIHFFVENPERALSRQEILEQVWGKDYYGDIKIVDVNIRRLRMKIEDDSSKPQYIQTVWGYGYKWNP